jgi:hypothetical protein
MDARHPQRDGPKDKEANNRTPRSTDPRTQRHQVDPASKRNLLSATRTERLTTRECSRPRRPNTPTRRSGRPRAAANWTPNWTPRRRLPPSKTPRDPRLRAPSMIGETGFEPATARPPAGCATRLRHSPWHYKRATGIEPALEAWKASVQPQHLARRPVAPHVTGARL